MMRTPLQNVSQGSHRVRKVQFFLTLFKRGGGSQTHVQKLCCKFCIIQRAIWQHKLRHRKDVSVQKCPKQRVRLSKFNIFTIDLHVILFIFVATGVNALLLKFLQKNSPHDVQTKGGGGQRPFEQCSNNRTFLTRWLPLLTYNMLESPWRGKIEKIMSSTLSSFVQLLPSLVSYIKFGIC